MDKRMGALRIRSFCELPEKSEETKMANKTTVTENEIKHALLDIEIEIDAQITKEIKEIKAEYNEAIEDFKIVRNDKIKAIKQTRRQTIKNARNEMLNQEA